MALSGSPVVNSRHLFAGLDDQAAWDPMVSLVPARPIGSGQSVCCGIEIGLRLIRIKRAEDLERRAVSCLNGE